MSEIEDRIVTALARRFNATMALNPEYDRKAEKQVWRDGGEYDVPVEVPATIEQMRERDPWIVFTAADGERAMRSATLAEIAEAVLDALPPWHVRDDTGRVLRVEHEMTWERRDAEDVPLYRLVPVDETGDPPVLAEMRAAEAQRVEQRDREAREIVHALVGADGVVRLQEIRRRARDWADRNDIGLAVDETGETGEGG